MNEKVFVHLLCKKSSESQLLVLHHASFFWKLLHTKYFYFLLHVGERSVCTAFFLNQVPPWAFQTNNNIIRVDTCRRCCCSCWPPGLCWFPPTDQTTGSFLKCRNNSYDDAAKWTMSVQDLRVNWCKYQCHRSVPPTPQTPSSQGPAGGKTFQLMTSLSSPKD